MELEDGIAIFQNFVGLHKSQLETSCIPSLFWEVLSKKLHNEVLDAGTVFSVLQIEYEDGRDEYEPRYKVVVSCDKGISKNDPSHIYLIDHAWTYSVDKAREHLRQIPGLLQRMATLMHIECSSSENEVSDELVELVFKEMWKFNQTYAVGSISNVEDILPIWYIMDEFGSAIQHSDDPTFRTVPFIHVTEGVTYTLLYPLKDVPSGCEVTRDFVEGHVSKSTSRDALLLPWRPTSFLSASFIQEEPGEEYFLEGHITETLPDLENITASNCAHETKLKVYSQYEYINSFLTHHKFEITSDENDADILWYTKHFKQYEEFSKITPAKYVNQFPYEHVITVKDLLSAICRRQIKGDKYYNPETLETYPLWLPTTFSLTTELDKFVRYYQHREVKGLDNHWICKPFNLARGLDTHITNNLNYIVRLPFTGPKIAQKYIDNPVLFHRPDIGNVKFDIRYVVLLKSVVPLESFAYRNFFLRFANYAFTLDEFDNYEKHFTVMNYNSSANLCRMLCHEFIEKFEQQFNLRWETVEDKIFAMLHDMFKAAVSKGPACGIAHNPQSRALYAVDIMLEWRNEDGKPVMQPKLLEVNFTPDCQRACLYYPDFYNDIFGLLFLNEMKVGSFKLL